MVETRLGTTYVARLWGEKPGAGLRVLRVFRELTALVTSYAAAQAAHPKVFGTKC